jgi:hypothetical protein
MTEEFPKNKPGVGTALGNEGQKPPSGGTSGNGEKRRPGPPLGSQNHLKHGLYARDAGRIDLRTKLDKAVVATISAIEVDLGGVAELSAQKRVILEGIRRKLKNVLKVDEYLSGRSIIDKRRRSLIPIVREQMAMLEGIRRDLLDLGLERRAKEPLTLAQWLRGEDEPERQDGNGAAPTEPQQAPSNEPAYTAGDSCKPQGEVER